MSGFPFADASGAPMRRISSYVSAKLQEIANEPSPNEVGWLVFATMPGVLSRSCWRQVLYLLA